MNYIMIKRLSDFDAMGRVPLFLGDDASEIEQEIGNNTCCMTFSKQFLHEVTKDLVMTRLRDIIAKKQAQVRALHKVDALFYLWFDEQACHLCFNVISGRHQKLPFDCALEYVDDPGAIVQDFLNSQYHEGISMHEFVEKPCEVQAGLLKVYAIRLAAA